MNVPDWAISGILCALGAYFSMLVFIWRSGGIEQRATAFVDAYIGKTLAEIEQHPEIATKFVTPLLNSALKALQTTETGGKEPMVKLPIIGKVPLSMVMQFLPGFAGQKGQDSTLGVLKGLATGQ